VQAVKEALHVPVLGNGDVRSRADADELMAVTGVDGVLSAISLLDDPGLFDDARCEK
jgi:tRNA-dihydrouridine synthase 1